MVPPEGAEADQGQPGDRRPERQGRRQTQLEGVLQIRAVRGVEIDDDRRRPVDLEGILERTVPDPEPGEVRNRAHDQPISRKTVLCRLGIEQKGQAVDEAFASRRNVEACQREKPDQEGEPDHALTARPPHQPGQKHGASQQRADHASPRQRQHQAGEADRHGGKDREQLRPRVQEKLGQPVLRAAGGAQVPGEIGERA